MSKLRVMVATSSDAVRKQIIEDYEEFESDGFIGHCVLRDFASEYQKSMGIPEHNITTTMHEVVFEVFRHCWYNKD